MYSPSWKARFFCPVYFWEGEGSEHSFCLDLLVKGFWRLRRESHLSIYVGPFFGCDYLWGSQSPFLSGRVWEKPALHTWATASGGSRRGGVMKVARKFLLMSLPPASYSLLDVLWAMAIINDLRLFEFFGGRHEIVVWTFYITFWGLKRREHFPQEAMQSQLCLLPGPNQILLDYTSLFKLLIQFMERRACLATEAFRWKIKRYHSR